MTERYLHPLCVWALAFGCIIGWGSIVMPGTTFLPIAGTAGTAIAVCIGSLIILLIAFNFHVMMNRSTKTGGIFSYTKRIFGLDHTFLCSWALIMAYLSLIWSNATAFVLIINSLFGPVFRWGFHYSVAGHSIYFGEIIATLLIIVISGMFSLLSKKVVARLNAVLALLLFGAILTCFGLCMAKIAALKIPFCSCFRPFFAIRPQSGRSYPLRQIFNIITFTPWAFIGFETISFAAEEFKFSKRKAFAVMAAAITCGTLSYIMLTLLAAPSAAALSGSAADTASAVHKLFAVRLPQYPGIETIPAFQTVAVLLGTFGIPLLVICVFCTVTTSMLGCYRAACRLMYAMAKNSILPSFFTTMNKKDQPQHAVYFIILASGFIPFLGRTVLSWLVDITTICVCIAYAYISLCCIVTGRREHRRLIMLGGIAGVIFSTSLFFLPLIQVFWNTNAIATGSYFILAVWGIVGFFLFRLIFQKDTQYKFGKSPVMRLILLFVIFFSATMWIRQSTHEQTKHAIESINSLHKEIHADQHVTDTELQKEKDHIEAQMDSLQRSILNNSLIQLALVTCCLCIAFNIYNVQLAREKKLYSAKQRFEESSRAKTIFLSNMSHDIRTPMNAIIGYTNLARQGGVPQDQLQSYLEKIDISSKHLLELINDVLEMSRIESGKIKLEPEPCNLKTVMTEINDMFEIQMAQKHITYRVDSSSVEDYAVLCDRNRLNRVLLNLVSNAYKFTPQNGSITVQLYQMEQNSNEQVPENYGTYELHVSDTGIGMSPEFAKKVFDPFERERTSTIDGTQGTGLGMSITKNIIDMMGGTISVHTEQGKGTEFTVRVSFPLLKEPSAAAEADAAGSEIPVSRADRTAAVPPEADTLQKTAAAAKTADAAKKTAAPDFSAMRLLLVDDIALNREIASLMLKAKGFTVETADNGKNALQKVMDSSPDYYNAVLMDIQMPVMDGTEAAKAIRALDDPAKAHIPIIAVSANAFSEDVQKSLDAGMNAHIAKPIDIQELIHTLTEVLGK